MRKLIFSLLLFSSLWAFVSCEKEITESSSNVDNVTYAAVMYSYNGYPDTLINERKTIVEAYNAAYDRALIGYSEMSPESDYGGVQTFIKGTSKQQIFEACADAQYAILTAKIQFKGCYAYVIRDMFGRTLYERTFGVRRYDEP